MLRDRLRFSTLFLGLLGLASLSLQSTNAQTASPAHKAAPEAAPAPVKAAAPQNNPNPAPVKFAAEKARPFTISGQAALENGQPLSRFHVEAGGFNATPIHNVPGFIRPNGTTFGKTDGTKGRYSIHIEEDATMTDVKATAFFPFHGTNYTLDLWPTDNLKDGTGEGYFRGHLKDGIVRNFILKMEGLRPGYKATSYPDHVVNDSDDGRFAYYGGTIHCSTNYGATEADLNHGSTSIYHVFPAESVVTLTLTPDGPLVNGLPGRVLKRSSRPGSSFNLFGLPYGDYTATAELTEPNGTAHPLRLSAKIPTSAAFWQPSAHVEWKPLVIDSDQTGHIIAPTNLWLAP